MDSMQPKSWLSKPEGKVGTGFLAVLIGGAGIAGLMLWSTILPFIISLLSGTLTAVGLAVALAAIFVVVTDQRARNLVWYAYKSAMRGLTSLFIEIDPIGILRTYVDSLREKQEKMDSSIDNLNGQITKLKVQIDKNEKNRVHSLELAQKAREKGDSMKTVFVLQARQAGRLEKSNMSLQDLYNRMSGLLKVLKKVRETSSLMIDDIQNEVELKTQERAALLAGYSAFTNAKKIMQGGGDEREMFNMTMENLTESYGMKMGEIDNFMEMSKAMIDGVDLENGVYEDNALKQLEAWEKSDTSLMRDIGISPVTSVTSNDSGFNDLFAKRDKLSSK